MAGHAQLQFVMTECSKTQIRLTELNYSKTMVCRGIRYFVISRISFNFEYNFYLACDFYLDLQCQTIIQVATQA